MTRVHAERQQVEVGDHANLLAALARGAGRHLAEGWLLAVRPMRLLHRSHRRQGFYQLQHAARHELRVSPSRLWRGSSRSERERFARRVLGHGRLAMRVLHARDRRSLEGAARQEGLRADARGRRPPPRCPPLPLHWLHEDPRRRRVARSRGSPDGAMQASDAASVSTRGVGCPAAEVREPAARPR